MADRGEANAATLAAGRSGGAGRDPAPDHRAVRRRAGRAGGARSLHRVPSAPADDRARRPAGDSQHRRGHARTSAANAAILRGMLDAAGVRAELLETDGNPLVFGELKVPGATRTILLYAHYDGQPVDPPQWKQRALGPGPARRPARGRRQGDPPPLEHAVEPDWRIYARSASDDKSPIVALVAALDALKAAGSRADVESRACFSTARRRRARPASCRDVTKSSRQAARRT